MKSYKVAESRQSITIQNSIPHKDDFVEGKSIYCADESAFFSEADESRVQARASMRRAGPTENDFVEGKSFYNPNESAFFSDQDESETQQKEPAFEPLLTSQFRDDLMAS